MNAKAVKDILISYLQARNIEIRIYQEKSIGSSICDVMTVTDRLTGYEIKSDLDNYTRLPDQIEAYDKFFDENYLVVGEKHMLSAFERVPDTWGIICVRDSDITVARAAKPNDRVSRRRQLSILWKLELKNLLVKNCMPAFAQKDKGYIADKIVGHVESALLGKQIAQELMRRDYSIYDAADYTIYSGGPDDAEFPAEEIVDVLSENNLSELTLDKWIALYKQAVAVREQKEAAFRSPDRQRISHAIPYTDIEVSLGVPWVSAEIINDFLYHILGLSVDQGYYHTNFVYYEPITGSWHIYDKNFLGSNVNAYSKYGTNRCKAPHILEATLNLREIKVFDNGKDYNEAETLAALEKQKLIKEEFRRWIWEDEDRRWMVEHAYNELFSKYEKLSFDGSNLTFPSMAEGYGLYPYQKDAVQRILGTKNSLLAFDVGAGKTYIMIAAAMKMREEGISRRNMFVVPNHIVGQWEKLFSQLYPQAKILAIEPKSFKPDMRRKVLEQIRDGDYDGVIIAYSCFEMIPLSVDCVLENMNRQLGRIENALHSLIDRYVRITDWCKVPLSSEKQYIIRLTNEFIAGMDAPAVSGISFDELEIDTLFLDEAHNYKNIPIRTKLRNLNGINTKGSKKCMDMLHKVRHVQQHGRGAVFATGTPLCNSISDAYTMQMYLQYDELAEKHLDVFDNWVKTYASPEQLCEIDVDTSRYRFIYRFARFFNLPELSSMFSQTAVFHATAGSEDLPEFSGYTDVVIEKHPELTDYMQKL